MTPDSGGDTAVQVRPVAAGDLPAIISVWHESKRVAYPYIAQERGLTLADNDRIFREIILPRLPDGALWVAEVAGAITGFMAIDGSYIDRLYIHPDHQRQGVGTALMRRAMALSPAGLQLHTHQKNEQARAFYEKHGFRAVKFGISPPPESEPDVEYHWTPAR